MSLISFLLGGCFLLYIYFGYSYYVFSFGGSVVLEVGYWGGIGRWDRENFCLKAGCCVKGGLIVFLWVGGLDCCFLCFVGSEG